MTVDAIRLRRARRSIYGPPALAVAGAVLAAAGFFGLATRDTGRSPAPAALVPPVTVHAAQSFILVDAQGRLSPGDPADRAGAVHAIVPTGATVVGAAVSPDRGHWLVTRDGQVIGVATRSLGQHKVPPRASPFVGIAASATGGYWLAQADGHVYAFGVRQRGDLSRTRHAIVVDIAATPDGGYWLAMSDGTVKGFATSEKAPALRRPLAHIVGIAASRVRGYWLASADGHVYPFAGASSRGDVGRLKLRAPVVDIASSPNGGYWLATGDGHVFAFGTPDNVTRAAAQGRIVAVLPA